MMNNFIALVGQKIITVIKPQFVLCCIVNFLRALVAHLTLLVITVWW